MAHREKVVHANGDVRDFVFIPDFIPYRLFKFMRDDMQMGSFNINKKTTLSKSLLDQIQELLRSNQSDAFICAELGISESTLKKYKSQASSDQPKKAFNSPQSVYNAIKVLEAQELIKIYDHEEYGHVCELVWEWTAYASKDGSFDDIFKMGHIKYNSFLISEDFFNLELRDQKAVYYFLYDLKNDATEQAKISLKSRSERRTQVSEDEELSIEKLMRILKVNRRAHVLRVMEKIKKLFHFEELKKTITPWTFMFKLHKQYRSEKRTKAPQATPVINQTDLNAIRREFKYRKMKLSDEDAHNMAQVISPFNKHVRQRAITQIAKQIDNGYDVKKNIAGLLKKIALDISKLQTV